MGGKIGTLPVKFIVMIPYLSCSGWGEEWNCVQISTHKVSHTFGVSTGEAWRGSHIQGYMVLPNGIHARVRPIFCKSERSDHRDIFLCVDRNINIASDKSVLSCSFAKKCEGFNYMDRSILQSLYPSGSRRIISFWYLTWDLLPVSL